MIDINDIRENAWSFPGTEPPPGAELIASEVRNGDRYFYYTNPDEEDTRERPYLYQTESGYRYFQKMEQIQKKHKKML